MARASDKECTFRCVSACANMGIADCDSFSITPLWLVFFSPIIRTVLIVWIQGASWTDTAEKLNSLELCKGFPPRRFFVFLYTVSRLDYVIQPTQVRLLDQIRSGQIRSNASPSTRILEPIRTAIMPRVYPMFLAGRLVNCLFPPREQNVAEKSKIWLAFYMHWSR